MLISMSTNDWVNNWWTITFTPYRRTQQVAATRSERAEVFWMKNIYLIRFLMFNFFGMTHPPVSEPVSSPESANPLFAPIAGKTESEICEFDSGFPKPLRLWFPFEVSKPLIFEKFGYGPLSSSSNARSCASGPESMRVFELLFEFPVLKFGAKPLRKPASTDLKSRVIFFIIKKHEQSERKRARLLISTGNA